MAKDYPVGKAQKMVLDALGLSADGFTEAERVFEEIGITVVPVRQGKTSVPQVHLNETSGGALNADYEGESWTINYKAADLSKVSQWMVAK